MTVVSIIIPAYDRVRTIGRAIESVLQQTVRDIEVIVVDDASRDNTVEVVQELMDSDSRVRLIRNARNRGAQAARNLGARSANGEWLSFFDSDDWMLPTSLEFRLDLARDQKVKVVHSECFVLRPDGGQAPFGVPPLSGRIYDALLRAPGPTFPGMIIATDAFRSIGGLDEHLVAYQEWDTAIRLAKRHAFGFLAKPSFVYDCTGSDTISKNLLRGVAGYEYIIRKHRFEILLRVGPKALSHHLDMIAGFYTEAGALHLATRSKWKSFLWWPSPRRAIQKLRSAMA